MTRIQSIQTLLGVEADGVFGPKSKVALDAAIASEHRVVASVFADWADLRAFKKCKAEGGYWSNGTWHPGDSDEHCFACGDNGEGYWGDNTAQEEVPMVALSPEEIIKKWGSVNGGKQKVVLVTYGQTTVEKPVETLLTDIMPHESNMTTDARIDLNPATVKQLNFKAGDKVIWTWA